MSSDDARDPRRKEEELRAYWAGLDLLWDASQAPPPPVRRRGLDLGRIVRAAISIADAEGLDAVSMRRVASKLGTGPMSLYRHVPDKDALVLMMIDAAYSEVPSAPTEAHTGDWRSDLRAMVDINWTLMRRHTWLPEAMLVRPPLTPRGVAGLEWALAIFDAYDLDIGTKMQFVTAVHFTVLSAALNAAIEDRTRKRLQASDAEIMHSSGAVIERIAGTGAFPRVMRFIIEADHLDETGQLHAAIELILDGIDVRLAATKVPGSN